MARVKPTRRTPDHPSEPALADPGRFAAVSRRFEIEQIALVRTSAQQSLGEDQGELDVSIGFTVKKAKQSGNTVQITVRLWLDGVQDGEGQAESKLRIDADFRLTYRQLSGPDVSDADLAAFADLNARFNVWPYWREYVQNTMARMLLPPLTVPLMKVRSAKKS